MRGIVLLSVFLITCRLLSAQSETLLLVYSHNTNGVLENCNCPEHSYGALEKRAFIIDSLRKIEKNVLLLDTGDILDIRKNVLLHSFVMRAYARMDYDFWTAGDQDFIEGTSFFLNDISNQAGQLLANNILCQGKAIGLPWSIKKFGGIRIGLTGTIRPDLIQYLDEEVRAQFTFLDQMSNLIPVVTTLSKQCDFIILLSHSGIGRDREIAEKFPQINLILGGHSQTLLETPEKHQDTYITQVGESGYRLGIIRLSFEKRRLIAMEQKVILLTREKTNDPQVARLITDYHLQTIKNRD